MKLLNHRDGEGMCWFCGCAKCKKFSKDTIQMVLNCIPEEKAFLRTSILKSKALGFKIENKRLMVYLKTTELFRGIISNSFNRQFLNKCAIDFTLISD